MAILSFAPVLVIILTVAALALLFWPPAAPSPADETVSVPDAGAGEPGPDPARLVTEGEPERPLARDRSEGE